MGAYTRTLTDTRGEDRGDIDSKVEKISSLVELLNDTATLELINEYDNNQKDTPIFFHW